MDIIRDRRQAQAPAAPRPQKQATRRRLIEAAADVIAERGYQAATLGEIAARAELTTGAVYSAFGSKQALLIEVCKEVSGPPLADHASRLAGGASLRQVLERIAVEAAQFVDTPGSRRLVRLQIEIFQLGLRDPGVFPLIAAEARAHAVATAELVERLAARDGITLPMPALEVATVFNATLNGLAQLRLVAPHIAPVELFVRAVDAVIGAPAGSASGEAARARRRPAPPPPRRPSR